MILRDLLSGLDIKKISGGCDKDIKGISYNSADVQEGYIFVALRGGRTDGHRYIRQALERGARALLVQTGAGVNADGAAVIEVDDTRRSLARVSSNYYGNPTMDMCLVGITGTNGKTTVTYMLESIWTAGNLIAGVIGTIDYRYPGVKMVSSMTTPESPELMRIMSDMNQAGVDKLAMEVSSHALDKDRVLGCNFDAAVFTNLTQDHLDYHMSMECYLDSKKKLFTELLSASLKERKHAVINADDEYGRKIAEELGDGVITYSAHDGNCTVYARNAEISRDGIKATVATPSGDIEIDSTMFGSHNLSNILAAVAAAVVTGSSNSSIESGIRDLKAVPGRLEQVDNTFGFSILVDYAHTPDALENVLTAARPLTDGALILVFGCGGDRDRTKRPKMGAIGDELSDILIVTSDNPRTEQPASILKDIEEGISDKRKSGGSYYRLQGRAEAIRKAVSIAKPGDTVLIAGKGHEDYQILGNTKHHFDDREVAAEAVAELSR